MTSFASSLLEHGPFLRTTDSHLHDNTGARGNLLCFYCNLLGQFASGGYNNGPDVIGSGPLVSTRFCSEGGVILEDTLDNGDEETKSFASTSFGLGDAVEISQCAVSARYTPSLHVDSAQCLIDSFGLHVGHSSELHPLGDDIDNVWVDKALCR